MAALDTLELIHPSTQLIYTSAGNLVGIKNPHSSGVDLRVPAYLGANTYANIVAAYPAASFSGIHARATDIGPNGMLVRSDGTNWVPEGVQVLSRSALPIVVPSSGSSNASGQITFTTALPYQPGGSFAYVYLPSGVVTGGSQGTSAGVYVAVFSSTTVCQIAGSGITSANGAYTQTTATDLTLASVTVPGGSMGANGRLRATSLWSAPNNANIKSPKVRFGGSGGTVYVSTGLASGLSLRTQGEIANRGATNSQVGGQLFTSFGVSSGATVLSAVDTSVDTTLLFQANIATATDYMILEGYLVEVMP